MKADTQTQKSHYKTPIIIATSISLVATAGELILFRAEVFSPARGIGEGMSMIGFPGYYLASLFLWAPHGADGPAAFVLTFVFNVGFYSALSLGFRKLWRVVGRKRMNHPLG